MARFLQSVGRALVREILLRPAEQLRQVQRLHAGAIRYLGTAGEPVGEHDGALGPGPYRGEQSLLADCHRRLVLLGLESPGTGEPAAAGAAWLDGHSGTGEHPQLRRRVENG